MISLYLRLKDEAVILLQTKAKIMLRGLIFTVCFFLATLTLLFWYIGSHEHIRFRPHMKEDWVYLSIVCLGYGIPLLWLTMTFIKRARKKIP